jgi:hypothetical protein
MKRQLIAIALGSVFALPVFANNEIDAGSMGTQYGSDKSGQVFVNAEQGWVHNPMQVAGKTREQVRAEAAQREVILNAELGTTRRL